jgi:hypothetical protein
VHAALFGSLVVDRPDGPLDGTGTDRQLLRNKVRILQAMCVALEVPPELAQFFSTGKGSRPDAGEFRQQGFWAAATHRFDLLDRPTLGAGTVIAPTLPRCRPNVFLQVANVEDVENVDMVGHAEGGPPVLYPLASVAEQNDGPDPGVEQACVLGHLAHFVGLDSPATGAATRRLLGWDPVGPTLLEDLEQDHYYRPAG